MNVQNMLKYTADLSQGVTLTPLRMAFVRGEALAHMFIITAYENNQKVDLTGATVNGYMMRADQTTLTFDGSVSGGNAVISLPGAAYSVTGRFRLAIQATMNGVTTTLFYGEGAVSPSTTDIVAIPEEILMPSLENIEAQVEEMVAATAAAEAVIKGAVVRNLLDNSDFQINQRGLTEYTTTSSAPIYTVDRWKMNCWNTTASLRVESKGVRLVGGADGPNSIALLQTVDALKLRGKALTVAVKMGNLTSTVRKFFIYFNNEENYVEAGLTANGIAIINAVVPADANTATVYIGNQGSWGGGGVFDGLIEWVALYEGTYTPETLPAYQPKGYAAELAECQMRYRLFKDISVPWSNNHEGSYIEGFLPISMKSETGGIDIQCENAYVFYGGQYKTVTSLSAYRSGSGVKIACTTDSANSSNQDGMIFASTMILSRDL